MLKAWLKWSVFWLGLMLCLYALWHVRALAVDAISRVSSGGWVFAGLLLVAAWALAVMAWRQYLQAYVGHDPGWRVAMRQVGLLLVGKYVPGGVFGFLARVYDQPGASRLRLFWAGLVEQAVGVALALALGGVLYLAAARQNLAWICLAAPLPLLACGSIWLLHRLAAWLPWLRARAAGSDLPDRRGLLSAIAVHLAHQLGWVALAVVLVQELYGLDIYAALGVAGAFWWAVALGMLAVIVPGGIGVREAALVGLASPWLDTTQAILLTVLLRLLSSVLDAGAGGVAVLLRIGRGRGGQAT